MALGALSSWLLEGLKQRLETLLFKRVAITQSNEPNGSQQSSLLLWLSNSSSLTNGHIFPALR